MGKLHSLRREILRNPEKWRSSYYKTAYRYKGKWRLGSWYYTGYRNFVESVLKSLDNENACVGHTDVKG